RRRQQRSGFGIDTVGKAFGKAGIGRIRLDLQVQIRSAADRNGAEDLRRVEAETRTCGEVEQQVAFVGNEGVDVDESLDVGHGYGGVGDDEAAVGMPDQHDRAGDRLEEALDIRAVFDRTAQGVRWDKNVVAVVDQLPCDGVPAGAVSPVPVHQHDGGFFV